MIRFRWRIVIFLGLAIAAVFGVWQFSSGSAPVTYFVDCQQGSDQNRGTTLSNAWKSLEKANAASLAPGDSLLFRRGCAWEGTLRASWNGTAARPIRISAYGSGPLPVFYNAPGDLDDRYHNGVDITGSYQRISFLETAIQDPPRDPGCANNPVGFFAGFNFRNVGGAPNGGSYNALQYSKASGQTAGIHTGPNTHHNLIRHNTLVNNHVMSTLTPPAENATDDIGAWGILLRGSDHEVAYNFFSNNRAQCTYDTPPQGNAIELYEAQDNHIHHNVSVDDRVFSELGGSRERLSANNDYAYNLVVSSVTDAHFLVTRGEESEYGPVRQTQVINNTIYYTGPDSEGIVCGAGCSERLLTAKNNIIWAEKKAIFADEPFDESNNIFWSSDGSPLVQLLKSPISRWSMVIDPQFVDPAGRNFHLRPNSAAIDSGTATAWRKDLNCVSVPQGGIYDIGAFEYTFQYSPTLESASAVRGAGLALSNRSLPGDTINLGMPAPCQ